MQLDAGSAAEGANLANVVTYHVVEGVYMASDITDGLTLTSVQGENLVFSVDGGAVKVNDATVVVPDIPASNGVIHKIDGFLVPESEKQN